MTSLHMSTRKFRILSAVLFATLLYYVVSILNSSLLHGAGNESMEVVLASLTHSDTSFFTALHSATRHDDTITPYTAASVPSPVPLNKGNEAIVYLTHLITRYDKLAPITLFLHHHATAWHNPILLNSSAVAVVVKLNRRYVVEHGFTYVGCDWRHGCDRVKEDDLTAIDLTREDFTIGLKAPHNEAEVQREKARFRRIWTEVLPDRLWPARFGSPRGGQFAISRQTARSVPRNEYERLRQWIIETELDAKAAGAVFEQIWHLIVGGDNNENPCVDGPKCYCDLYSVCLGDGNDAHAQQQLDRAMVLHDKAEALEAKMKRLRILKDARPGSNRDNEMKSITETAVEDGDVVGDFDAVLENITAQKESLLEEYREIWPSARNDNMAA